MIQYGWIPLNKDLPDAQCIVRKCIILMKQQWFILPQLSTQDLLVDLLTDRLVLWHELTVNNSPNRKACDQHDFSCFLIFSGDIGDFPWLSRFFSRSYSKIHVSLTVITQQIKSGSVWKRLIMSWYISMRLSFWSSFTNLGTNFAQTFYMPNSSVTFF